MALKMGKVPKTISEIVLDFRKLQQPNPEELFLKCLSNIFNTKVMIRYLSKTIWHVINKID